MSGMFRDVRGRFGETRPQIVVLRALQARKKDNFCAKKGKKCLLTKREKCPGPVGTGAKETEMR